MDLCSKPRCTRPGAVALAYDYANRRAILQDHPEGELSPHLYALCAACAERLSPPRGWTLDDERESPPLFAIGSSHGHLAVVTVEAPAEEEVTVSKSQLFFGSSI